MHLLAASPYTSYSNVHIDDELKIAANGLAIVEKMARDKASKGRGVDVSDCSDFMLISSTRNSLGRKCPRRLSQSRRRPLEFLFFSPRIFSEVKWTTGRLAKNDPGEK